MNFLKNLILIICSILFYAANAYSWSSVQNTGGWTTHQFLNKKAYERLMEHPAFQYSVFPSIDEIQRYSGANIPGIDSLIRSFSKIGPVLPQQTL